MTTEPAPDNSPNPASADMAARVARAKARRPTKDKP